MCIRENWVGKQSLHFWINTHKVYILENAEQFEMVEPDLKRRAARLEVIKRQDQQVYRQIPFERKDVPPALEPGKEDYKQISGENDQKRIK